MLWTFMTSAVSRVSVSEHGTRRRDCLEIGREVREHIAGMCCEPKSVVALAGGGVDPRNLHVDLGEVLVARAPSERELASACECGSGRVVIVLVDKDARELDLDLLFIVEI